MMWATIGRQLYEEPQLTDVVEFKLQKTLSTEMGSRLVQLVARTNHLQMESDEIWKTVETTETNLLEILNQKVRKRISNRWRKVL